MPFQSRAQQRAMHAKANRGEIKESVVKEFDRATAKKPGGFRALPARVAARKGLQQAMGRKR